MYYRVESYRQGSPFSGLKVPRDTYGLRQAEITDHGHAASNDAPCPRPRGPTLAREACSSNSSRPQGAVFAARMLFAANSRPFCALAALVATARSARIS